MKRNKVNSMTYFSNFDFLITGGSERFINIYENISNNKSSPISQK